MSVTVEWLGHASFKITGGNAVVYIDPWKIHESPHDASLILISHSHYDHYSADDVARVSGNETEIVASGDVVKQQGAGTKLKPGKSVEVGGVRVTAVAAYNPDKQFHPKFNDWLGFIIEIEGRQIYYAGDTDETAEMQSLSDIDLALLPVGGTYTMNAEEAAEAVSHFKPKQALPYHWGDIVGGRLDAEQFLALADCQVEMIYPGESITL